MSEKKQKDYRKDWKERDRKFSHIKDAFIEFMEKTGTAPWHSSKIRNLLNYVTKGISGEYKNVFNQWLTAIYMIMRGWDCNVFYTSYQISQKGGRINKGEKAVYIVKAVFKFYDGENHRITEKEYKELLEDGEKAEKRFVGYSEQPVFNLAQTNLEYEHLEKPVENDSLKVQSGEEFVERYKDRPEIVFDPNIGECDAYYSPSRDEVHILPISAYESASHYYKILYHELIHSTEKRLNLKRSEKENEQSYAFYELRAEIGANLGMTYTDMDYMGDIENSGAYVKYWIGRLKGIEDFQDVLTKAFNSARRAILYWIGEYVPEVEEKAA